ncbi:MAG TPA: DUF3579 domain-containing protein [Gammaproteobacteria bacterium]|nr:DUF3579 domain-containing protein [Gammaproteobacteria bacterium]
MTTSISRLVIESVVEDGRRFRPSDWIERLSATWAQFGPDHRLHYARTVRPQVLNGEKCLVVDRSLERDDPVAFDHILAFARSNGLRMRDE